MRCRQRPWAVALSITAGVMTADFSIGYGWEPPSHFSTDRVTILPVADTGSPSLQPTLVAEGVVERYLMDPRGDVEGLLLTDGTQLHVTSRAADALIKAIKPGHRVRVHGSRKKGDAVVSPDVIVNVTAGTSFSVPLRLDLPLPSKEDRLSMSPMKAGGRIRVLLHRKNGEVQGMVLSDGVQIRLPPDASDELRRSLRIGQHVNVEGYGTENEYGRSIEALAISADKGPLTPLDPTIRQLP